VVANFARNRELVLNSGTGRSFLLEREDDLVDGSSQLSSALLVVFALVLGNVSSASSLSAPPASVAFFPRGTSGIILSHAFGAVLALRASLSPGKMSLSSSGTSLCMSGTSGIISSHAFGAFRALGASRSPGGTSRCVAGSSGFSALLVSGAFFPRVTSSGCSLSPSGHSLGVSSRSALLGFVALLPSGTSL